MAHKYGDAVILVFKSPGGSIRRVNAIVLAAIEHQGSERLDVAYPRQYAQGVTPRTRNLDELFQFSNAVKPVSETTVIGWDLGSEEALSAAHKAIGDMNTGIAILRQQLEEKGKPSAADLDAIAEEEKARLATQPPPDPADIE